MSEANSIKARHMEMVSNDSATMNKSDDFTLSAPSSSPGTSEMFDNKSKTTVDLSKLRHNTQKRPASSNKQHVQLIHTTTRIVLTCFISMTSSAIYQLVWNISMELESLELEWATNTWSIDAITNMICVYLSMGIANNYYEILCRDLCKCHQCCFKGVMLMISHSTKRKTRELMQ